VKKKMEEMGKMEKMEKMENIVKVCSHCGWEVHVPEEDDQDGDWLVYHPSFVVQLWVVREAIMDDKGQYFCPICGKLF
jgi:predicted RNA-binding Zn-ribbon protein involved in translation (DUF1610 family)